MVLNAGTRLGAYEIVRPLGAGGMGEVYRARDLRLGRDIALKVLPETFAHDADHLARLEREARILAGMSHPNLVTLHSFEDADGIRFLTMELVEGQSLADLVTPAGLPLERVLDVGIAIADALTAAHERQIVHRDLKPANVMVTRDGRIKVLDFGLAKVTALATHVDTQSPTADMALSATGVVAGTVPYMAPEQVRGEGIDARADLFALGGILYELAAGRRPFTGASLAETSAAILRDTPVPLTHVRGDLPLDIERIVCRCLEKDPRDRFQTAPDLSHELHTLRGSLEHRGARPGASAPDRATIAVLPFENLSADSGQEYFADGIVEEITTGLSRIKWLFVISRNSTLIYKGQPVDVKAIGRSLGVRYLLQGSVRRSGNQVRVTGQLIDTQTAAHVWADRYDGTLDDIFALQDEMTMSVISAVEPTLRKAEVERARRTRPNSLDAYDLFLRALPLASAAMPDEAGKALDYLQEAIRLEPHYGAAHGLLAWCLEQRYLRGDHDLETKRSAIAHAQAAIEAGSDDAMALAMGGFTIGILERDYEAAIDAIDRSLALSPSSALAFGFSSIIRAYQGELPVAIEHAKTGIRLGPYDPLVYLPHLGLALAQFFSGNFVEAAGAASRASAASPRFSVPRFVHAAALVRLGRPEEARAMADVVLGLQPGFTISATTSANVAIPERMAMLAEALEQAGLPK